MSGIGFKNFKSIIKLEDKLQSLLNEKTPPKLTRTQTNLILVSIMLFNVGYWSTIDFPQTLGDTFLRQFHISTKQVGYIYSISYFFSIIFCPLTGVLISRFGIPNISLLMAFFIFAGNVMAYFGVRADSFSLVVLGRIVFSFGAEALLVAQASASEKWFSGKMLSISMGINLSCGVTSGSLSNYITPIAIVEDRNLEAAFLYYVCAGALSFFSVALFTVLDWKYGALIQHSLDMNGENESSKGSTALREALRSHQTNPGDQPTDPASQDPIASRTNSQALIQATSGENYVFKLNHLWKLGPLYWCCVGIYTFASNSYYQFTKVITNAGVHRFGYSYLRAKNFLALIQIVSAFIMPLNSIFILNYGKKLKVLLFSTASLLIAYTTMTLSPPTPSLSFEVAICFVALFEITYQSTIYPCVAMSLPRDAVSIGFGLASFVQAFFLTALPYLLGIIIEDETRAEYQIILFVFVGMVSFAIMWVLVTMRIDYKLGGILDAPENSEVARKGRAKVDARFKRLVAFDASGKINRGKKRRRGNRKKERRGVVTIEAGSDNKSSGVAKTGGKTFGASSGFGTSEGTQRKGSGFAKIEEDKFE